MLVKIEARFLIFPGTDFHFPSTSVRASRHVFRLCNQVLTGNFAKYSLI